MSGEFVIKQAKAGHDEADALGCLWGGREQVGGCDWQAAAGGCGHQTSANCKVKKQRESVMCCCTFTCIEQGAIDLACCLFVQMEAWCVSHRKVIRY